MEEKKQIYLKVLLIIVGVVALDQLVKLIIRKNMTLGQSIPEGNPFISILYLENDGIAFSFFSGNRWTLVALQIILIVAILFVMSRVFSNIKSKYLTISFAMMLGGGVGNLIDRIATGQVVDFISIGKFAVFNIADMSLTIGCAIMVLFLIFSGNSKEAFDKDEEDSEYEIQPENLSEKEVVERPEKRS